MKRINLFFLLLIVSAMGFCKAEDIFSVTEETRDAAWAAPTSKITCTSWVDGPEKYAMKYVYSANGLATVTGYIRTDKGNDYYIIKEVIKGTWKRVSKTQLRATYTSIVTSIEETNMSQRKQEELRAEIKKTNAKLKNTTIKYDYTIAVLNDNALVLIPLSSKGDEVPEVYGYTQWIRLYSEKEAKLLKEEEEAKAKAEQAAKEEYMRALAEYEKAQEEFEAKAAEKSKVVLEVAAEAERIDELYETMYDKKNDIKIVCTCEKDGTYSVFNDNGFSRKITKMYVNYDEVPVSNKIEMKANKAYVIIFKTNAINRIEQQTFYSFDGTNGRCAIIKFYFPSCLRYLESKNGAGCSYCTDLYFYGLHAPRTQFESESFCFKIKDNNSKDMGNLLSEKVKKTLHIFNTAKMFSPADDTNWAHLNGLGYEKKYMQYNYWEFQ